MNSDAADSGTGLVESLPPVMVADDDPGAVLLLRRFLKKLRLGNRVDAVSDGDEAVEYLEDAEAGRRPVPVLALLDLGMPGRSGLDVLAWIRSRPVLAELPVVILTGSEEFADMEQAQRLSVSSYLVKPVGFEAVGDVLRRLEMPWAILPPQSSR